jgi:hypothetical protein
VGAEQLEQVPSLAHRPDGVFRSTRTAAVGPTYAVDAATGAVACGIKTSGLVVLGQDWEEAFFVEKCPGCFAVVVDVTSSLGSPPNNLATDSSPDLRRLIQKHQRYYAEDP